MNNKFISKLFLGLMLATSVFSLKAGCKKDHFIIRKAEAVINATSADLPMTGLLRFSQLENGKVQMLLDLSVPGKAGKSVAVHIHEHGMCGNAGSDAHGHWNPTGQQHGKWASTSFHSGDIGNIQLDAYGKGSLKMETNLWSIGGDSTTNIVNRGIIVHGGIDDYSQPAGNSGARIGCGIILLKQ